MTGPVVKPIFVVVNLDPAPCTGECFHICSGLTCGPMISLLIERLKTCWKICIGYIFLDVRTVLTRFLFFFFFFFYLFWVIYMYKTSEAAIFNCLCTILYLSCHLFCKLVHFSHLYLHSWSVNM